MIRWATVAAALILVGAEAGGAAAADTPATCTSAEKARANFSASAGEKPKNPLGMFEDGDARAYRELGRAQAAATLRQQMTDVARLCMGDLASVGDYSAAMTVATRFGLFQEAEQLARLMAATKAATQN